MANEIHNLEKVVVYLKCLPTCRIHEHLNIKTAVNFAVDLLNSTEMEILGFLEKFITDKWFQSGPAAENLSSMSRTFITAWRSAIKLFGPTS